MNLSTSFFFTRLHHRQAGDSCVYYSRSLFQSDFSPLAGDVDTSAFRLKAPEEDPSFSAAEYTQVWLGAPGFTTQCHFDYHPNFYSQINGTKTFILAPPSQHLSL